MRWSPGISTVFSLFLVYFVSFCEADGEVKKKVPVLLNDEDAKAARRSNFEALGISMNDLKPISRNEPEPPPFEEKLSPGDEYVPEKSSKPTEGDELYEKALKFLEKGKGHGAEGKKAAYRLIDQAAQLGHLDAKKVMAFAHLFGDRARWSVEEAKKIFTELAAKGSADGHLGLAFMHGTGFGLQKSNQAKAILHYTFSALGGNPLAQMALGYRYLYGIGVAPDCEIALSYYEKVAQKVANKIKFSTGVSAQRIRLTDENEPTSSSGSLTVMDQNLLDYYRFLADKGDTAAQSGLGQLYLTGSRGVEQNFELASKYFSAAAEAGHAGAFAHLGKMYLDGTEYTPQDNVTAFTFFLKSAEKGNPTGQTGLGIMYLRGAGVHTDYEKAARLFALAAEQGGGEGQLYLGELYMKGFGVKRDFKTAIKYYQMASQNSQILAFYNLAVLHATGTGVARSCNIGVEFYKNVAERGRWTERLMEAYTALKDGRSDEAAVKYLFLAELGYEPAQTNFAYLLDKGDASSVFTGTRNKILEKAFVHWLRSANQDHAMARIKVGDYFYYGWGVDTDYTSAAAQYKLAAERHMTAQAMFNLAYMHEQGLGLEKDLYLAKRYYDQASEHSADAYVPVALALVKLGGLFILDALNQLPLIKYLDTHFGASWDLVFMGIIAVIIAMVVQAFMRRRNAEQQNADFNDF